MQSQAFHFDASGWCQQAEICESPNFNLRPDNTEISGIIIHCISLPEGAYNNQHVRKLFTNEIDVRAHESFASLQNLTVSAHYFIKRDGSLTQFVANDKRAWHAGESSLSGEPNCNDFTIGIELEGSIHEPFEATQYNTLIALTQALITAYPSITHDRIVGHSDIAPARKTDPGPYFEWTAFKKKLMRPAEAKA